MKLSTKQEDLLIELSTNYKTGLSQTENDEYTYSSPELNVLNPPLNCPKWACIILPCINHIPSMKLFKQIIPRDAEVRLGNRWVCYDATSLNKGDIVRLNEGDIVPADVQVLNLGLDFVNDSKLDSVTSGSGSGSDDQDILGLELIVDSSQIDGRKPQTVAVNENDGTVDAVQLYAGSVVLQGEAIAVVTNIGNDLMLSQLIRDGKWPPKAKSGWEAVNQMDDGDGNGDGNGNGNDRGQELA